MRIKNYPEVEATHVNNELVKGVAGRVVIGKGDGAENFCMRVFEMAPGGHTPRHQHAWEHEIFVHAGEGEIFGNGAWHGFKAGNVVFVPGNEEHQIRNSSDEALTFVCLVPSTAPEL